MTTDTDPIVSSWYQHLDKGQKFQVVAVDESESVIDIQYFDGDIEEIDLDDWYLMDIEQIESPEDISGALDISELDDLGSSFSDSNPEDWDTSAGTVKGIDDSDLSEEFMEIEEQE
jgi:hypothetical protein